MVKRHHRIWGLVAFALITATSSILVAKEVNQPKLIEGGGKATAHGIVVGESGAHYALPGGKALRAEPGSILRVLHRAQRLALTPGPKTATYSVVLQLGRVDIDAPDSKGSPTAVYVSTPKSTGAIVVQGAATVIASPTAVILVNRTGFTLTKTKVHWSPAEAGTKERVDLATGAVSTEALLPAPPKIVGPSLLTAFGGGNSIELNWSPVPGAEHYRVRLETKTSKPDVVREVISQTAGLPSPFKDVPPGTYSIAVKAIDGDRIASLQEARREMRVIGVKLPEGSFFGSNGDVYLGLRHQAAFSNVEGLEMSYGAADYFVPAASRIGLYRHSPTRVLFRQPGTEKQLAVMLKPRQVRADVKLGPANAVWPGDPIQIAIRLSGPDGEALSEKIELKPTVRIGTRPIELDWRRTQRGLISTVVPKPGAGACVLRVEVTDQFGLPLGRNHLEISDARSR